MDSDFLIWLLILAGWVFWLSRERGEPPDSQPWLEPEDLEVGDRVSVIPVVCTPISSADWRAMLELPLWVMRF